VIVDLTAVRDGTGPARLLDMVEGRSKQVFKSWLADRDEAWRDAVGVVTMDGFTGFKTATAEELPDATAVMDPFHVVRLAGDALDRCRRRVQLAIHGHRGLKRDPLYSARRTLHTGAGLLTDKQAARLTALFADDAHVEVEATWGVYQRMIAAYRHEDRRRGRELMVKLIDTISTGVPNALVEVTTLGRTLKNAQPTCWPTSTGPAPATDPPRRSTAGSSTCAVPRSGSATSRTTPPDRCSRPEASGRNYTLDREEPPMCHTPVAGR
jgi:transposase